MGDSHSIHTFTRTSWRRSGGYSFTIFLSARFACHGLVTMVVSYCSQGFPSCFLPSRIVVVVVHWILPNIRETRSLEGQKILLRKKLWRLSPVSSFSFVQKSIHDGINELTLKSYTLKMRPDEEEPERNNLVKAVRLS